MGDAMCENYERAKQNREKLAKEPCEPQYWWEFPDSFDPEATKQEATTTPVKTFGGLARTRRELRIRQGKEA